MKTLLKPLFEACVDSYASCRIAQNCKADRVELCSHLIIGGATPSPALFKQVRRDMDIKINVLIRPRYGDFLYSDVEVEQMCDEIELFRSCGADGVVIGALTEDGDLDMNAMERMIACAGNMNITLHRAFDMTHDPFATLERAIALGVDTVLTSGQAENVQKGMEMLRELKSAAAGRIDIMAGSGVNSGNIKAIFDLTGITTFHASCKKVIEGKMKYKNSDVHMGAAMSEYTLSIADENELGECVRIVKSL